MSNIDDRLGFYIAAYFNISKDDELLSMEEKSREVINKCVNKAYQDLKRKVSYKYSTKEIDNLLSEEKKAYRELKSAFIEEISEIIISNIVVGEGKLFYEINSKDLHPREIIEEVIMSSKRYQGLFKEGAGLTVGLAQKWVNMTLKYLWILGVLDDEYEERLDIPLDSYVLEAIAELGVDVKGVTWSTLNDFDEYKRIQDELNTMLLEKGCTRIRWENDAWIKIATRRKK